MAGSKKRVRLPMPPWFIAALAAMLALAWLLQYVWLPEGLRPASATANGTGVAEIAPVSAVRFNEVMTSNRTAWAGANGRYPDWVELTNAGGQPADITGWQLTDRAGRAQMFTFPEHVLQPGEIVVVSCTGALQNEPDAGYQAPFRLSAAGDALMLFDAHGRVMESIHVPALNGNQVYARDAASGEWRVDGAYTPGLQNTEENHALLTGRAGASDSPVVINELMADNQSTLRDADGDYSDWIELINEGAEPVRLAGYSLSDDPGKPLKFRLPDVTLAPGECVLVFASGKDKITEGGEIHTNFKLNAEGETVVLTDETGLRAGAVPYELLRADRSYARRADGSYAMSAPSPGGPNP